MSEYPDVSGFEALGDLNSGDHIRTHERYTEYINEVRGALEKLCPNVNVSVCNMGHGGGIGGKLSASVPEQYVPIVKHYVPSLSVSPQNDFERANYNQVATVGANVSQIREKIGTEACSGIEQLGWTEEGPIARLYYVQEEHLNTAREQFPHLQFVAMSEEQYRAERNGMPLHINTGHHLPGVKRHGKAA